MKMFVTILGLFCFLSIPTESQDVRSHSSSEAFFSSGSYLGFETLMEGIGCLRRMGLGSGKIPIESENSRFVEQQLDRCIARIEVIMDRVDDLFPSETANVLSRNYFDGGLRVASRRYAECITGNSQSCLDQEGGIAETIQLMESSAENIEAELDDWYSKAYNALPDRISGDFRPDLMADGSGIRVSSFTSEDEFFSSQPFLAYVVISNGLACLEKDGLYSGEIKRGLRGDPTWAYAGLTSCMGRLYAMTGYVEDLFPTDTAKSISEFGGEMSSAITEYASCIVWEPREAQVCGASGPPVDSTGPATAAAIQLQAELTRWYNETWCPIPNRATTSAFCVEVVGYE